jgi:serine protease AprX
LPESDPGKKPFTPKVLDRTAIAIPLLEELIKEEEAIKKKPGTKREHYPVIIDLHLEFPGGRDAARERVKLLVRQIIDTQQTSWKIDPSQQGINESKRQLSEQYLFGVLEGRVIRELIKRDRSAERGGVDRSPDCEKRAIYRIWPDFPVKALLHKSISTVKADAALNSFSTTGDNIV